MTRSWRNRVVLFGMVLGLLAVVACKEDEERPPPAGDGKPVIPSAGGGSEAGAPDASRADAADASICTDLTIKGVLLDREGVTGEPPAATGGTIADGDYDLVSYFVYVGDTGTAGPTGISARSSMRISGGTTFEQIIEYTGSGPTSTVTTKSTFSAISTTFAETQLCPTTGAGGSRQYNASGTQLTLVDTSSKEAFTFTKR